VVSRVDNEEFETNNINFPSGRSLSFGKAKKSKTSRRESKINHLDLNYQSGVKKVKKMDKKKRHSYIENNDFSKILENKNLLNAFKEYLTETNSEDYLNLYLDVEKYFTKEDPQDKYDKAKLIGRKYFNSNDINIDNKQLSCISDELINIVNEQLTIQDDVNLDLLFKMVKDEVKQILNTMYSSHVTDRKPKVKSSRN